MSLIANTSEGADRRCGPGTGAVRDDESPFERPEMDELRQGPPFAVVVLAGLIGIVAAVLDLMLLYYR